MKYCLVLVSCLQISAFVNAQDNIDSLRIAYRNELSKSENENAAYCATLLGNSMTMTNQYDSAIRYYHAAMNLSKRLNFIASTQNSLGVVYNYKGYPDSCIRYYKEALRTYKSLQDTVHTVTLEGNLAIVYKNLGWYDEALETCFDALSKIESKPPDRTVASIYSTTGLVYLLTGDVARSIQYHRRALSIRRSINFNRGIGQSLTNIGEAFIALKQYDSALFYLFQAGEVKRNDENKSELGSTLNQIGRVYLLTNNTDKAEEPLLGALSIKRIAGERANEADVMNNIAHLRILQGRYREAQNVLTEAETLLRKSSDLVNLRKNLELEISLQKTLGNHKLALEYADELAQVKDSLLNEEKADIVLSMETRYEAQKKEKQILLLEKDKLTLDTSVKSRETSIAVLAGVVITMIAFAFFIYYQNQSLRTARDSNVLLLKEVNHRVKNNLQIISTLFRIPYQGLQDVNALRLIKSGESRVNAMALIHKQLSEKTAYRNIELSSFLRELSGNLDQSFGFSVAGGEIKVSCPVMDVDIDIAIPISLAVNELLANSMKYSNGSHITIGVVRSGNGVEIEIADNGIGFKADVNRESQGFGLRLIAMMVKELRGTIQTSATDGTRTKISIATI